MSTALQSIKGTFDVLPDDDGQPGGASAAWRYVEDRIRAVMARFHLEEVRTPMLEDLELFERGVGQDTDIVSKEMFVVRRQDEDYVLRPEITASVMRAYLEHRLDQRGGTQRLYYIGPCFRAERPQKGRYRQFHQFGAEFVGTDDARADVESIAVMMAVYRELGVRDARLRINTLGSPAGRAAYRDRLRAFLEPYAAELSDTSRRRLETNPLRILDTKSEREQAILQDAPRLLDVLDAEDRSRFDRVQELLDRLGIAYDVDPFLVRGLDYYTHTAYELESDALGSQSALAGGGRYDYLAEDLGSDLHVPAVGFAAGFERLFLALEASGVALPGAGEPDVFLVSLGDEAESWCFERAQRLRNEGFRVAYDLKGRSMKAQMKEANRQRAPFALIVGSSELERGAANLKDMQTGVQEPVSFDRLAETLRARRPSEA